MKKITFTDPRESKAVKVWESQKDIFGNQSIGAFTLRRDNGSISWEYFVYPLKAFERAEIYENLALRPFEKVYRCETERMRIARMRPLIKINLSNGRVYFLEDMENEEYRFETRGTSPVWMDLHINEKPQ